jgi:hypothetical protein
MSPKWLALVVLLASGCATPPDGKVWVNPARSERRMAEDQTDCNWNTFMFWPFDWGSKCMRRRGYELRDVGESNFGVPPREAAIAKSAQAEQKLSELKRLHDQRLISDDEYLEKKKKILDAY